MRIVDNGKFIKAIADYGKKIYHPASNSYHKFIIIGKIEYLENYREVTDPDLYSDDTNTFTNDNDEIDDIINS